METSRSGRWEAKIPGQGPSACQVAAVEPCAVALPGNTAPGTSAAPMEIDEQPEQTCSTDVACSDRVHGQTASVGVTEAPLLGQEMGPTALTVAMSAKVDCGDHEADYVPLSPPSKRQRLEERSAAPDPKLSVPLNLKPEPGDSGDDGPGLEASERSRRRSFIAAAAAIEKILGSCEGGAEDEPRGAATPAPAAAAVAPNEGALAVAPMPLDGGNVAAGATKPPNSTNAEAPSASDPPQDGASPRVRLDLELEDPSTTAAAATSAKRGSAAAVTEAAAGAGAKVAAARSAFSDEDVALMGAGEGGVVVSASVQPAVQPSDQELDLAESPGAERHLDDGGHAAACATHTDRRQTRGSPTGAATRSCTACRCTAPDGEAAAVGHDGSAGIHGGGSGSGANADAGDVMVGGSDDDDDVVLVRKARADGGSAAPAPDGGAAVGGGGGGRYSLRTRQSRGAGGDSPFSAGGAEAQVAALGGGLPRGGKTEKMKPPPARRPTRRKAAAAAAAGAAESDVDVDVGVDPVMVDSPVGRGKRLSAGSRGSGRKGRQRTPPAREQPRRRPPKRLRGSGSRKEQGEEAKEEEEEERKQSGPRRSARQQATRRQQAMEQPLSDGGRGPLRARRGPSRKAADSDPEYLEEEEEEDVGEEEEEEEHELVVVEDEEDVVVTPGRKRSAAAARAAKTRRASSLQLDSDSDNDQTGEGARRRGRGGGGGGRPQRKVAKGRAAGAAAGAVVEVDEDENEEEDVTGGGGRRKHGGGRRLRRTGPKASEVGEEDGGPEEALEDADAVVGQGAAADDGRNGNCTAAPSAAAGRLRCGAAAAVGGSAQRNLRVLQYRRKLTVDELREKNRRRLEGQPDEPEELPDSSDDEGGGAGDRRRRLFQMHPGLDEDVDAEAAAHAMYDSGDEDDATAAERALEDDVEEIEAGGGGAGGRSGAATAGRAAAAAARSGRQQGGKRPAVEREEEEDDDSFINDGEVEEDEVSADELPSEEEVEEPRTPQKRKGRGGGAAAAAGASGLAAAAGPSAGPGALRSPPVSGKMNSDKLENFKSWVTPMLCKMLHLQVGDEDENELEQQRMDQEVRSSYFENELEAAKKRTMSYNWIHAVDKLGLAKSLVRYPRLLIDGMTTAQFFGRAGTAAVQDAIARADEEIFDGGYLDEEALPKCDICHARRSHLLHVLTLEGDPVDGRQPEDEEEEEEEAAAAGDWRDAKEAEEARKRRAREFLAGGMCCERIVLYHAICHFKRWLGAALKRRLKYLLRPHQHLRVRSTPPGCPPW